MIHLDTSFLVLALTRGSAADRALRGWLLRGERVCISAIGWAEFLCGPVSEEVAALASEMVGEPASFATAEAALTARLFNAGGRRRGSLADCMIAASAIRAGASLATANPRDFVRFEEVGLTLQRQ